jgi:ABC-type transport system involved in multi-copper enzyme maturation permease subunit
MIFVRFDDGDFNAIAAYKDSIGNFTFIAFLFVIIAASFITADYAEGTLKNIFSKGIGRTKFYVAGNITMVLAGTGFVIFYVLSATLLGGIKYGFGHAGESGSLVLLFFVELLLFAASVVVISFASVVCKKSTPAILLYILITFLPSLLTGIASALKLTVNFNYIGFNFYLTELPKDPTNPTLIFGGIAVAAVYIGLSIMGGALVLKKQDIK